MGVDPDSNWKATYQIIPEEEKVIKEVTVSKFDDSFRIEAYISTFDGYGGQGDILSKFGVRSTDEITFVISKERYADFITPKINLFKDQVKTADRPQEGDLVYFPATSAFFEIQFVEHEQPFYQQSNLPTYKLSCTRFKKPLYVLYDATSVRTLLNQLMKQIDSLMKNQC